MTLQGLVETQHPYTFITKAAFIELCEIPGSVDKVLPLLARLIPHIKLALVWDSLKRNSHFIIMTYWCIIKFERDMKFSILLVLCFLSFLVIKFLYRCLKIKKLWKERLKLCRRYPTQLNLILILISNLFLRQWV